jgi:hypothetical protein
MATFVVKKLLPPEDITVGIRQCAGKEVKAAQRGAQYIGEEHNI